MKLSNIYHAQNYLRELKYNVWHRFDDIPGELFDEVFDLIEENYLCKYVFGDSNNFMKVK